MGIYSFDQGPMGHVKPKPTSVLSNLPGIHQLHEVRGPGSGELPEETLEGRMKQSRSWATWAPGFVQAVKQSLKVHLAWWSEQSSSPNHVKALNAADWRRHVEQGHIPYRRDCRQCLQAKGIDNHHRRSPGDQSSYCMSIDLVGPFSQGRDLGTGRLVKYALVATIPVPKLKAEEGSVFGTPDEDELEVDEGADPLPLVDEPGEVEGVAVADAERLNKDWLEKVKHLSKPVGVQNITLVEMLCSRSIEEVIGGLSKVHARFRSMGLPIYRLHSDREKTFLSKKVQAWCGSRQLWQTMTAGDESASNGRVETEVAQFKRELRLLMAVSIRLRRTYGLVLHAK